MYDDSPADTNGRVSAVPVTPITGRNPTIDAALANAAASLRHLLSPQVTPRAIVAATDMILPHFVTWCSESVTDSNQPHHPLTGHVRAAVRSNNVPAIR